MAVNFECLLDSVLLQEIPRGETPGGIALPDRTEDSDDMLQGRVVSVGPGVYESGVLIVPAVKEGDVVYAVAGATPAAPVRIGSETYVVTKSRYLVGRERT